MIEKYRHLAWSNPNMNAEGLLKQALLHPQFESLIDFVSIMGLSTVERVWESLRCCAKNPLALETDRMLKKIREKYSS